MHLLKISFVAFPLLFLSVYAENDRQERQLNGNFGNQKNVQKRQLVSVSSSRDGGGPQKHTRVNLLGKPLANFDMDAESGSKTRQRRQLISVSSSGGGGPKKNTDVNVMGASLAKFETDEKPLSPSSSKSHRLRRAAAAPAKAQEPLVSFSSSGTGAAQQRNIEFMGAPLARISGSDSDPLNLKGLKGDPLNLKGLVGNIGQLGQDSLPTLVGYFGPLVTDISAYATDMSSRITTQLGSGLTGLPLNGKSSGIPKSKYNPLKPQKPKVCDGPFCDIMERGT